jgi:tetratricopeptide (TPR) repeat protein
MIDMLTVQQTQHRLAQHYLNKLRMADEAIRRGPANIAYGLTLFDQEWEQIRHWQTWTTHRDPDDTTRAQLCKEFPFAGSEVLPNRNTMTDHVVWLESALEAARQLHDQETEHILCHNLVTTYYRLGILDKVRDFASQLLELGEATHNLSAIGHGYHGLGIFADERGLYAEAKQYYQRAREIFTELGLDTEIRRQLHGLAGVAFYLGDYQETYDYLSRHLEVIESSGNKAEFCTALLMLGEVLISLKDYAEAEKYLERGVGMSRMLGFQRLLGVGLLNFGHLAIEQNQLDTAIGYLEEGIRILRAVNIQRQITAGLSQLGYICLCRGEFSGALAHLNEALALARAGERPRAICIAQLFLANTYLASNELDAAHAAIFEALALAQEMGTRPQKVRGVSCAVAYYQRLEHHVQAAVWTGAIIGDPDLDESLFMPVCTQLEAVLGRDDFQKIAAQGKMSTLDDVVTEILRSLA